MSRSKNGGVCECRCSFSKATMEGPEALLQDDVVTSMGISAAISAMDTKNVIGADFIMCHDI